MRAGLEAVGQDLVALLRYQGFGGAPEAKNAASSWLGRRGLVPSQERLFITPGAHPALLAIFGVLAKPGEIILSESITYPGARSIALQLGLQLTGLPMDDEGIDPEALADACIRLQPKALYLNPTLHNPTTLTVPAPRRQAIADVARRFKLPIVEDDAYGFLPVHGPAPFAALGARADLAYREPCQMLWRGPALRLCRCAGRPRRLAFCGFDARGECDGLAAHRGAGDALDRGRHRRRDPALHPPGNRGAPKTRRRNPAPG